MGLIITQMKFHSTRRPIRRRRGKKKSGSRRLTGREWTRLPIKRGMRFIRSLARLEGRMDGWNWKDLFKEFIDYSTAIITIQRNRYKCLFCPLHDLFLLSFCHRETIDNSVRDYCQFYRLIWSSNNCREMIKID